MYAVIRSGGKQHKVKEGDILEVERLEEKTPNEEVILNEVLLINNDKEIFVGQPLVQKAKVVCEFLEEIKGKKVIAFKYRRRKDSKTKKGHRQISAKLKVKKINETAI